MITFWVITHPWANVVAVVVLVLLGPVAGAALAAHPRPARWLTALALVPVAVLTLSPAGSGASVPCAVQWTVPTFATPELMANVVLFVPPALLAVVASRRPVLVLLAGSALSALVEAVQWAVVDLGRACDTTDWSSNTLGTALGVALGWLALLLHRARAGRNLVGDTGGRGR